MENAIIIVVVIALIGLAVMYQGWLKKSIQARTFTTNLSPEEVRSIFTQKVGGKGWKIVDDGNPMVAQSNLATGIRQQIQLHTAAAPEGATAVRIAPARVVVKGIFLRIPKKAHTLRIRMDSFTKAVTAQDGAVDVQLTQLSTN